MSEIDLTLLLLAAICAGFVDAVAGGGGLIQVPALLAAFPLESPATVFGTNKMASIFGTASAALRYVRRISIPWAIALPAAVAAFGFSYIGATSVAWLPRDLVRPVVLVLLVVVMVYTLLRPGFGLAQAGRLEAEKVNNTLFVRAALVGSVLGFYDGFFGPGTGSFLIFAFVRWFDMDYLIASGVAKVVNFGTNAAALAYFAPNGYVLFWIGAGMAFCNVLGAQLGSRMAIQHGSRFVRWIFIGVAGALILRLAWDTFGLGRQ